jgi:hypothetical protein
MDVVEISDIDNVLRRIRPDMVKPDGTPSSQNFTGNPDPEISCHLERLADVGRLLDAYPGMLLARLKVGEIRQDGRDDVRHDPVPDDHSHSIIVKLIGEGYSIKARKKKLTKLAKLIKIEGC